MKQQLLALVDKWEKAARFSFLSAAEQKDDFGRRFIEHGAMCYVNCATDLKEVLVSADPLLSATQVGGQK